MSFIALFFPELLTQLNCSWKNTEGIEWKSSREVPIYPGSHTPHTHTGEYCLKCSAKITFRLQLVHTQSWWNLGTVCRRQTSSFHKKYVIIRGRTCQTRTITDEHSLGTSYPCHCDWLTFLLFRFWFGERGLFWGFFESLVSFYFGFGFTFGFLGFFVSLGFGLCFCLCSVLFLFVWSGSFASLFFLNKCLGIEEKELPEQFLLYQVPYRPEEARISVILGHYIAEYVLPLLLNMCNLME